ncbi:RpiB/LacA/LacB family sugar-phosphate isomerase [soil metagenome]
MKIAISSDTRSSLTDAVIENLQIRGHDLLRYGALVESSDTADPQHDASSQASDWPVCTAAAAHAVAAGEADEGIVFCFTGTGASIAANKVDGIRAALVHDATTAEGARVHNHANVLVMSIRATSETIAAEILEAWFSTPWSKDDWNVRQVARVDAMNQA